MTAPCCGGGAWQVVCATGPRPWKLDPDQRPWVRERLDAAAVHLRDVHSTKVGLSGFAQGTDLWWADSVIRAGLILGAHIPCEDQIKPWTSGERAEWNRLRALADGGHSHRYADEYSPQVLFERNRGMIAAASFVVVVYRPGRPGGTVGAIRDAHGMRRPGYHINPDQRRTTIGLPPLALLPPRRT